MWKLSANKKFQFAVKGSIDMPKNELVKQVYRKSLNCLSCVMGVGWSKKFDARVRYHRKLNLSNPTTLADKVSWIELNTDQRLAAKCTDKYEVRSYVASKGLEGNLIPLCGGPWESVKQINVDLLPSKFVLKATHGCEMNYICTDKNMVNTNKMLSVAQKWLQTDYPRACVEPHYRLIPHRLYAEEFVGGIDDTIDYKYHCINGEPVFCLTCSNRRESLKLNLHDCQWAPLAGLQGPMKNNHKIPKPKQLNQMLKIARTLSSDFDFVRVDLYEKEGNVFFGELTFSPAGGVFPYFTDDFIAYWGLRLKITKGVK